ncbi:hypothetical protein MSBR3_2271 [Methanosarcina barkeri 3]|uniref:DUF1638 domain-containing protein n=2 Tax=Methanosarcina barkeri TaxID=2208 RepID=A0A0E3WXC9_METBA|nr:hypothetical protein MSBR3_2271 [Methanosarcina barkeri 3]
MPVLSIIACEMLEDELAYVLSEDHDLGQLIVLENRQSFRFVRKLKSRNCQLRLFPLEKVPIFLKGVNNSVYNSASVNILKLLLKFQFFEKIPHHIRKKSKEKNNEKNNEKNDEKNDEKNNEKNKEKPIIVVNTLKLGLHADCELLRSEIYQHIKKMAAFSDGILIFYGNCGHSLRNTEEEFKDLPCSLYFLKDEKGEIVDDCISVALGGNDNYAEVMQGGNGTGMIYLTPMWASSWKQMRKESNNTSDFNDSFLKRHYKKVVKINNNISTGSEFDENVLDYAQTFDMSIAEMEGSMEIASRSYLNAKNNVCKRVLSD